MTDYLQSLQILISRANDLLEYDLEGADDGYTYQRKTAILQLKRSISEAEHLIENGDYHDDCDEDDRAVHGCKL